MRAPDAPAQAAALRLAGAPQVLMADGQRHDLGTPDALLLAWLALNGSTARQRLAMLLWPDSDAESARNALRQRLFRLRRQCAMDLVSGSRQLRLADGLGHDLNDADHLLGHLAGPAGEMQLWLHAERERRGQALRQRQQLRITEHESAGDFAAALALAAGLIEADPLSEEAHRLVMRLHYLGGERSAALRAFDRLEHMLKHEVGTRPSPETLNLLATIEQAETPSTVLPTAPRHRLPAALLRPPRLVGRLDEQARLQAAWQAGRRMLVVGEAGMGKSRLVAHLADGLAGRVCASAARPGDALSPYATLGRALREVLRQHPQPLEPDQQASLATVLPELVRDGGGDACPGACRAWGVEAKFGPGEDSFFRVCSPIAVAMGQKAGEKCTAAAQLQPTLPKPDRLLDRETAVKPSGQRLLQAIGAVLQAVGQEGLVLDDLHFADAATLELLPSLLDAHRGAWVLSLRAPAPGTPQQALLQALQDRSDHERLDLKPLGCTALAELIDSLALPGVAGAALASALRERSGGNPLFALETLKQAWEGGGLQPGGVVPALPPSGNVSQLIQASLSALSPAALMLARVAAVAGADFSVDLACHVLHSNALQLADAWAELEARQVLRDCDFAHDLVHDGVLQGLPAVLARHTHGLVAQWLAQRAHEPARLAAHWEAAGQALHALPALRAAAQRAHLALRVPERIAFLLRGADIAQAHGQADDAFSLVAQAVEAHMNTVRHAAGLPLVDRLDSLARTPHQQAQALGARAWYATNLGDWPGAIAAGQQALALCPDPVLVGSADREALLQLQASVTQRLGTALALSGQFAQALPLLRSVQSWVDSHAASDMAAEFHGNLATVLDNLGHPAQAEPHHQSVIAATRHSADHAFLVTALANHAVSRLNAGDVQGALGQLQASQQLVSSYGLNGASAGFVAALQAQAARALGHYGDALRWCDTAQDLLREASPGWLPVVGLQRVQVLLELGQWARASQLLQASPLQALPARLRARHGLLTARHCLALGDRAAAQRHLAAALHDAPTHGWPEQRLLLHIEQAGWLPSRPARKALEQVMQEASDLGLVGLALAARLRLAALPELPVAVALQHAREAQQALPQILPNGLSRLECWLGPAQGLAQAGDGPGAAELARRGLAWMQQNALAQVHEAWRDAYLQRLPAAISLQRLAQVDQPALVAL